MSRILSFSWFLLVWCSSYRRSILWFILVTAIRFHVFSNQPLIPIDGCVSPEVNAIVFITAHQPSIANSRFWILWNLMVELGLSLNALSCNSHKRILLKGLSVFHSWSLFSGSLYTCPYSQICPSVYSRWDLILGKVMFM
jgi:hypothetical protein